MNIDAHILQATGRLDSVVNELEHFSQSAIDKVSSVLPIKDVDLVLYDNPEGAIEHIGIGGYTPNAHLIYISLNPQLSSFSESVTTHLARQIAHELHHTLRWQNPGYGTTLLEAIISEGLADVFSYEVFPGEIEEWDKALSENQLVTMEEMAKKSYFDENYNHFDWFFGSDSIPKWTGYTLGFKLVTEFVKKQNTTAATLYNRNAKEFI